MEFIIHNVSCLLNSLEPTYDYTPTIHCFPPNIWTLHIFPPGKNPDPLLVYHTCNIDFFRVTAEKVLICKSEGGIVLPKPSVIWDQDSLLNDARDANCDVSTVESDLCRLLD